MRLHAHKAKRLRGEDLLHLLLAMTLPALSKRRLSFAEEEDEAARVSIFREQCSSREIHEEPQRMKLGDYIPVYIPAIESGLMNQSGREKRAGF
ncbi:hypothetical protein KSP40_PGU021918 [Platanthera guangdongensis]|uniref:Uncharacterized protein n=1 Tax=Platanthera guangdongensis TaxID=2320717 RepID=A0ABR2MAF7_9ASPA